MVFPVVIIVLCSPVWSFAFDERDCVIFRVKFDKVIESVPADIVLKKKVVGKAYAVEGQVLPVQEVEICIDRKYSGAFEKNTMCYITGNTLQIYNLWSTGIDLAEGDSVVGLTSNRGVFLYEVQLLLDVVKEKIIAVLR